MMLTKTVCIVCLISVTKHPRRNRLREIGFLVTPGWRRDAWWGRRGRQEWEATVTLYCQDAESEDY